mgnify:CR=1 FL=1
MPNPIPVVNDLSVCYVTAAFFDQSNNPAVPVSLNYRIDDVTNESNILPWTALSPTDTSITVTVTSAQNAMSDNDDNISETRQVLFKATGTDGQPYYVPFYYDLRRLVGVP